MDILEGCQIVRSIRPCETVVDKCEQHVVGPGRSLRFIPHCKPLDCHGIVQSHAVSDPADGHHHRPGASPVRLGLECLPELRATRHIVHSQCLTRSSLE
eukprot:scaffold22330_cov25-Prasinocladus_malaysianus.AAC.1